MEHEHIGHKIIGLSNSIRRLRFGCGCANKEKAASIMREFFMGEIYRAKKENREIYQKDLESRFSIRRSTASEILGLMEKNGLITRTVSNEDARLKSLHLTDTALEICRNRDSEIEDFEIKMSEGLSEEEIDTLLRILDKIKNNVEKISTAEEIN